MKLLESPIVPLDGSPFQARRKLSSEMPFGKDHMVERFTSA